MFDKSMNFALGEEIDALRDMVRRFAQERIAPRASEIDRTNEFPNELWKELGALGLLGVTVEELVNASQQWDGQPLPDYPRGSPCSKCCALASHLEWCCRGTPIPSSMQR